MGRHIVNQDVYYLTVYDGGDLTGAVLEVTRQTQYHQGKLVFNVIKIAEETENKKTYILEEKI